MDKVTGAGKVNIYLLQHPKIEIEGRQILKELNSKALTLILYLAANLEKVYSREVLSELFWPELPMENSKSNLRQVLWGIKKACANEPELEDSIVTSDKGTCFINREINIFVDLPNFYERIEVGLREKKAQILQESIDLYTGSFLEGFYVKGSAALDEWILFERESVGRTLREGCKTLATLYEEEKQFEKAAECLNKLIKTDPLQEDVHRGLMNLYYKSGDRNKAVSQYNQCVKLFRKELNVSPMEETRKLYEDILQEDSSVKTIEKEGLSQEKRKGILSYHHHYLISNKEQMDLVYDRLLNEKSQCYKVEIKANPFGNVEYEGFYQFLQPLLESNRDILPSAYEVLRPLFPEMSSVSLCGDGPRQGGCTGCGQGEVYFAGMFHTIERLITAFVSEEENLLIVVHDFEQMDGRTKELVGFLLGNIKKSNVHIIVKYEDEKRVKHLIDGFSSLNQHF